MIKPVEGLNGLVQMDPVKKRQNRKQQQEQNKKYHDDDQNPETTEQEKGFVSEENSDHVLDFRA